MTQWTTGRQRDYALSMGIVIDRNSITRSQLSQHIDSLKPTLSGPPNEVQLQIIQNLGLEIKPGAIGSRVSSMLFEAFIVQAFIFSVYRKHMNARWKFHDQTGLNDEWVFDVMRTILGNRELHSAVYEYENTHSETGNDVWFNMGKGWLRNAAVVFVLNRLGVDPATLNTPPQNTQTIPPALSPGTPEQTPPPKFVVTSRSKRKRRPTFFESILRFFGIGGR